MRRSRLRTPCGLKFHKMVLLCLKDKLRNKPIFACRYLVDARTGGCDSGCLHNSRRWNNWWGAFYKMADSMGIKISKCSNNVGYYIKLFLRSWGTQNVNRTKSYGISRLLPAETPYAHTGGCDSDYRWWQFLSCTHVCLYVQFVANVL